MIASAAILTMIAFVGLTLIVFQTRKDFSFLGGILFDVRYWWPFALAGGAALAAFVVLSFTRRKVDHAARFELDDDKDEQGAEESIVGLHEIASPDLAGMVAQKGGPGLL